MSYDFRRRDADQDGVHSSGLHCARCNGTRVIEELETCWACDGMGMYGDDVVCGVCDATGSIARQIECPECPVSERAPETRR